MTGLSDFHKLVVTTLKMYLPNNPPKVITYRDCKNFDNSRFSEEFLSEMKKLGPVNKNISIFHNIGIEVLEKYTLKNESLLEQIKQILWRVS